MPDVNRVDHRDDGESEERTMLVLGVLLMLACAALAVDAVIQNTAAIGATVFNHHVGGLSLGAVFIAGSVIGLLFALGLTLFAAGAGRRVRRRRERRTTRAAYPAEPVTTPAGADERQPVRG